MPRPETLGLAVLLILVVAAWLASARRVRVGDLELGIASRAGVEDALHHMLREGAATALVVRPGSFHELLAAVGREQSDALLRELAARLSSAAGPGAVVGRIAPACFALALPGEDGPQRAGDVLGALDAPLVIEGVGYPVAAAAGSATGPADAGDASALLDRAEIALHAGGAPHRPFHEAIEQEARRRLAVLSDLERALAANELHLQFQPIIDIATGAVGCVEALVRWEHPEHGAMSPATFVPLAEQTELIGPMTEHVLALALDQCAAWREDGLALRAAVNLSARNVADPRLAGRVGELLAQRRLPGEVLKLEITESVLMEQPDASIQTLSALRTLGVAVALDDFGTGYSSLAYLKDLPLDEVKIDRAFVRVLRDDPRSAAVMRAIVALADELDLRTVAEGVEDLETLRLVAELGCDGAQGFHITRPLAPAALRAWLARRDTLRGLLTPR